MFKLKSYIKEQGVTQRNFAKLLGITPNAISKYLANQRFPNRDIILKIEKATNGYVRPSDWYTGDFVNSKINR